MAFAVACSRDVRSEQKQKVQICMLVHTMNREKRREREPDGSKDYDRRALSKGQRVQDEKKAILVCVKLRLECEVPYLAWLPRLCETVGVYLGTWTLRYQTLVLRKLLGVCRCQSVYSRERPAGFGFIMLGPPPTTTVVLVVAKTQPRPARRPRCPPIFTSRQALLDVIHVPPHTRPRRITKVNKQHTNPTILTANRIRYTDNHLI